MDMLHFDRVPTDCSFHNSAGIVTYSVAKIISESYIVYKTYFYKQRQLLAMQQGQHAVTDCGNYCARMP